MSTDILEKDITDLFGLDEMDKDERETFLGDVGNLILESAVTRLMADMNEDEKKQFEGFVSENSSREDFLEALEQAYPKMTEILKGEITAFKSEAIAVLGKEKK